MNRRDAIKLTAAAALLTALSATAEEEVFKNREEMKPENPAKLQESELKHTPQITIGKKDAKGYTPVSITVGQGGIIHPSTPEHWIDFVELYADKKRVGKSELEAEISRGAVTFAVKLDQVKTLTAKAGCNLHGIWTSTLAL